LVSLGLGWLV